MDCSHCDETLPISPLWFEGQAVCGKCLLRIKRHRKPAPVIRDTMPPEERGDPQWAWLMGDTREALREMPEHARQDWIGKDEWKRKRAPWGTWSFAGLLGANPALAHRGASRAAR